LFSQPPDSTLTINIAAHVTTLRERQLDFIVCTSVAGDCKACAGFE